MRVYLGNQDSTRRVNTIGDIDLSTAYRSRQELNSLDVRLVKLNSETSSIGATQSRLEVSLRALGTRRNSYQEAFSTISDADVAQEAASLTAKNILQQSAASVLARANQQPALALTLLKSV